jgi:hypothetical protein
MQSDNARNIVDLVERLRSDTPVEWGEVETLVAHIPAWRQLVQLLRESGARFHRQAIPTFFVQPAAQERLLELFRPYAILLEQSHSPAKRALQLEEEAGVDVRAFCEECLSDHDATIVEAARAVLEAWQLQKTLVRGAGMPEDRPDELLRAALPDRAPREDALLHPAEAPDAQDAPPERNWLLRLFARRKA